MAAELTISDITQMRGGLCVLGLSPQGRGFCSIRPIPHRGNSWSTFPYSRGDVVRFELSPVPLTPPHIEDRSSGSPEAVGRALSESDLVSCLSRAEVAEELNTLFNCAVHPNVRGHGAYVEPGEPKRSICGVGYESLRFDLRPETDLEEVRVRILLQDTNVLDLRLVDRDWRLFASQAHAKMTGANQMQRLNRFLNEVITQALLNGSQRFVRIGLTRLFREKHWLMLDSLFPAPQARWLSRIA